MENTCSHNCLVIGGDGKLGPVWIEKLLESNTKVIATIEPGKSPSNKLHGLLKSSKNFKKVFIDIIKTRLEFITYDRLYQRDTHYSILKPILVNVLPQKAVYENKYLLNIFHHLLYNINF